MALTSDQPITVWGSNISYFTGKLENYLRLKGIDYSLERMHMPSVALEVEKHTGVMQMPALTLSDGRWLTDTSKIIEYFEQQSSGPSIYPHDPLQRFIALLLEDYADEWLWRPAMHFRWYYPEGAHFASRHLVGELASRVLRPGFIKRAEIRFRQRYSYTRGDGITKDCVAGVEAIFFRTLEQLQAIFEKRPFIFGDRPSLADVGFSGPFFRHFALDPIPLEIIRQRAPAVLEWVARLWNTTLSNGSDNWVDGIPEDIGPLLNEIGSHYLPYLNANVAAVQAGRKRFNADIGGIPYRRARYSKYRVWCLQELRKNFLELSQDTQRAAQQLLELHSCWEPLWLHDTLPLEPGQEQGLPFHASTKMIGVNE